MNWPLVLWLVFLSAAAVQLLFFLVFYLRLWWWRPKGGSGFAAPVSVIICARNEEANLLANLPLFFEQDYPEFEVIVVDDCSLDNTANVLRAFQDHHPKLKVVPVYETDRFYGGKKYGLTLGIKAAQHEHLVFSDADCLPASKQWLRQMVAPFGEGKSVILGYGAYQKTKGLLNRLIRFDTFNIAANYFGFALTGWPYMGVGRNLAYKRSLFFKHKGFARHLHLLSGDDDLFINEVATAKNIGVVMLEEARTESEAKATWTDWWYQKKRHLTTASHYRWQYKSALALLSLSQLIFFLSFIHLLGIESTFWLPLVVFGGRFLLQMITFSALSKRLGEKDLVWFSFLFEIVLLLFYLMLGGWSMISKSSKWAR
ncbi:MAG: glycosyltransferase [Salibacteraceae bacterium]